MGLLALAALRNWSIGQKTKDGTATNQPAAGPATPTNPDPLSAGMEAQNATPAEPADEDPSAPYSVTMPSGLTVEVVAVSRNNTRESNTR